MYEVFYRAWWRIDVESGKKLPNSADRGNHVKVFDTDDEAREFCSDMNEYNLPFPNHLSYKYEFREISAGQVSKLLQTK